MPTTLAYHSWRRYERYLVLGFLAKTGGASDRASAVGRVSTVRGSTGRTYAYGPTRERNGLMSRIVRCALGGVAVTAIILSSRAVPLFSQPSSTEQLKDGSDTDLFSTVGVIDPAEQDRIKGLEGLESRPAGRTEPVDSATNALSPWRQRLVRFRQELTAFYHEIVSALGPGQPAPTSDSASGEHPDPRVERVSRGFFEDMKDHFGDRDSEDAGLEYQEDRLRGMSDRVDQQFEDVSRLLQEFEEEQRAQPPDR